MRSRNLCQSTRKTGAHVRSALVMTKANPALEVIHQPPIPQAEIRFWIFAKRCQHHVLVDKAVDGAALKANDKVDFAAIK